MGREEEQIAPLPAYLSVIRDLRVERNKLYPLEEVIIITILGHFKPGEGGKALHIVSAWATGNRLVFGQVKTGTMRLVMMWHGFINGIRTGKQSGR